MQYTVYLIMAPIALVIEIFSTIISWRERKVSGYQSLPWILVCVCGFLICNILELITRSERATLLWARLEYVFLPLIPVLWVRFSLEYSRWLVSIDNKGFLWLCLVPLLTCLCAVIPPINSLLWSDFTFEPVGTAFMVLKVTQHGFVFWLFVLQSYLSIAFGSVLMIGYSFTSSALYRRQSFWVVIGALLPLVSNFLYISKIVPGLTKDFSPVGYSLAGIFFTIGITRYQLLKLMPIARDTLVEQMQDGVIVLDPSDCIVDLNPIARVILDLPFSLGVSSHFTTCLIGWTPNQSNESPFPETQKTALDLYREKAGEMQFIHLDITWLVDIKGSVFGKLVIIRDISERILTLRELQRSRDELETRVIERTAELAALNATLEERVLARTRELSILYDITRSANQAANLPDLLLQVLKRTIEVMHSKGGAIYLAGDFGKNTSEKLFTLNVQIGIDPVTQEQLRVIPANHPWIQQALCQTAPLVFPFSAVNKQFPGIAPVSLFMVGLKADNRALGFLFLANPEEKEVLVDDFHLFESIANQLSTVIRSQELRQQAILYEERQRLSRDLHDSVTQSLYGLVTLTEAGQAMLETGHEENIGHTLIRIGQTARQTLKEMRLYIYQLRPPALEEEGLLYAIQMRLTAVEARSNINTRLCVEDHLLFSDEASDALYQITQEALNNILRHTLAADVTVRISQQRRDLILEVIDNGCGFDPSQSQNKGMGLANMKTRAERLGGCFEIWSRPGEGTRVLVRIPVETDHPNPGIPSDKE